jgi:hypothetical protein
MVRALTSLRDAHTFYALPQPYKGSLAFLPFRLRSFHEKTGERRFIVTNILDGFDHPRFNVRAEILTWNGMPVEQASSAKASSTRAAILPRSSPAA